MKKTTAPKTELLYEEHYYPTSANLIRPRKKESKTDILQKLQGALISFDKAVIQNKFCKRTAQKSAQKNCQQEWKQLMTLLDVIHSTSNKKQH